MELRRVDWGSPRCFDTGMLQCYDGATILGLAIDRGGRKRQETTRCADAGLEFWSCVEAVKTAAVIAPSPTYDEKLAAGPEPMPSPKFSEPFELKKTGRFTSAAAQQHEQNELLTLLPERVLRRLALRPRQSEWPVINLDDCWWRQRRLRWFLSRIAWKRLMRSLRGNTVEKRFTVALWNAREFHAHASVTREASHNKRQWLRTRLEEERPDACFLLEVMGDVQAFTAEMDGLRAWAQKIGYVARWITGEGGSNRERQSSEDSYTNGIAVLVNQATCFIERYVRIEERVLGVWLRGRGDKAQVRMRVAALHGLHHEGASSFNKQRSKNGRWTQMSRAVSL